MSRPTVSTADLPDGVSDTFTHTCPYGCTVHVHAGQEKPHSCDGESLILDAWRSAPEDATFGQIATRMAEALKPLLREHLHQAWLTGMRDGRSGERFYGVPEDDETPGSGS